MAEWRKQCEREISQEQPAINRRILSADPGETVRIRGLFVPQEADILMSSDAETILMGGLRFAAYGLALTVMERSRRRGPISVHWGHVGGVADKLLKYNPKKPAFAGNLLAPRVTVTPASKKLWRQRIIVSLTLKM